ncbi:MAG: gamma-glutamylcyclotransferase [Myxococcales bacterium]
MKLLRRTAAVVFALLVVALLALHLRIQHLVHLPVPGDRPAQLAAAEVWYFAYGSNMSSRYLYNVRGVLPAASEAGVLADHEVVYLGPGINLLEPAFAYLVKAQGKQAHGVLHRVSTEDLNRVKESEGPEYVWVNVPVQTAGGEPVQAQTLLRLSRGTPATPSRRYVDLLVEGATEQGLPARYVAELKALPAAYVPVASEVLGDLIMGVVMRRSAR